MKRELMTLAATLGLTLAATASPVGMYFNDDFSGTSLNTTIWTNYTSTSGDAYVAMGKKTDKYGTISDVPGWVTGHGWNYNDKLIANYAVSPDVGETVILSSTSLQFTGWAQYNWWGLTSGDSKTDGIFLRQNFVDTSKVVQAEIHKNGAVQYLTLSHPTDLLTGGWNIAWTPTRVKITSDIWGTIFDSTVQTLDNNGNPWNLPTANLAPTFESFYGSTSFDDMKLEVVPEPAMVSLALLGAAALGLRRRRQ